MTKEAEGPPDPSAVVAYGEPAYWDDRYKQEGEQSFDWYQRYSSLAAILDKYVPKKSQILVVGCGNSAMSADMLNDGYTSITNIDISSVVIETMQEKCKKLSNLIWETMDVRSLTYGDASFDAVIDKGTLDSLMCGDDATVNARKMLSEVSRVLKPGGVYLLITYGDPRLRTHHLEMEQYKWRVNLHVMPRPDVTRFTEERQQELIDEPVIVNEHGQMAEDLHWDDPDIHYIYVCLKEVDPTSLT